MRDEFIGYEGRRFKTEKEARATFDKDEASRRALKEMGGAPQKIQYFATVTDEERKQELNKKLDAARDRTASKKLSDLVYS